MSALDSTPTATVVDGALDASAVTTVIEQAVSPTTDGWVNARASSQGSPPTNSPRFRSGSLAQSDASHRHPEPVTKQCEHYLLDYQLWDRKKAIWIPYDPSTYVPPPEAANDKGNYFHVKVQYHNPAGPPAYIICKWSQTPLFFMRAFVGNNFFDDDPEENVKTLFPYMRNLRTKPSEVKCALEVLDEDRERARSMATDLGCQEVGDANLPDSYIRGYLHELDEHLPVLIDYTEEHFKLIEERLSRLRAYGHIEFDLLPYLFHEGDRIATDDFGQTIAFVIQSRYSQAVMWGTGSEFIINGYGYEWDGNGYVQYTISRTISDFTGTRETTSLICQHLTDEAKQTLRERGKLYTTLSGTHYRTFVVDRLAYDNPDGYTAAPDPCIPELAEERLHLLPHQVKGFNLAHKEWSLFDVERLEPVVFDMKAWDHLVLDPDTKTLIKALVKVNQNSNVSTKIMFDVISGKGGGLIAVLHGPPGTGKTLTAESVAELLHHPLYMVGFSELSTEPSRLEANLKRILSLATAWDAVLLIDEADVFLEQRSLHEIERNAIVSVALRVLEYHRGVLFLTTNRIKTFDEAFLSRFSIAIKYPELDHAGRLAVWEKFFKLAGCVVGDPSREEDVESISAAQLNAVALKPFNGRTIKNIVRTAQALAISSEEELCMKHVKIVTRAQERFLEDFASIRA